MSSERDLDAHNFYYVVDSGASRGALPKAMFKGRKAKSVSGLTSSNGTAMICRYESSSMPRVHPGEVAA